MEYVLFFFVLITGVYLTIFKMVYVVGYIQLYQMEDYTCIPRFRKIKKFLDLLASVYNASFVFLGIDLLVVSSLSMDYGQNHFLAVVVNTIATLFLFTVFTALIICDLHFKLSDQKLAIENQWKIQKCVSADNDHEVRCYNLLKLVMDKAPIRLGIGLIVTLGIHLYLNYL